ncbi:short-subunit dehydrogenase [Bacillus tianshenii]|uniref:Short-subunit dehydrogenase n=1 Tax=Sutcliffiella tianshenii TaxID=1463404 RepID=A0ABS2NYJ9_9BACI|nr:SDR family NAD(P)-dependent oxidoreductase [Bacillus tianshenii]MBM7619765.1 short-subunit dehydrogenase [Bacillus tianshenii]
MHNYTWKEKLLFGSIHINLKKLQKELRGKTVLITGASSGIGERLAYLLADTESHLILVARRGDKLSAMKEQIDKRAAQVSIFCADLRNEEEMRSFLSFLHTFPQGLDVVVSNAGISIRRSIFESLDRLHDFKRTMAINYFAPVELLLSVIPMLKKNKGQIINISTINMWMIPLPFWSAYQASKSAFDTWLRSAGPELNASGITTTTIYLPLVRTPMILPTASYRDTPAMSPDHASKIIAKVMYTKRRIYTPWWLVFAQWGSVLFRCFWERMAPAAVTRKKGDNR